MKKKIKINCEVSADKKEMNEENDEDLYNKMANESLKDVWNNEKDDAYNDL
ncbi:hypothetical protein [Priestia megaterium]|jgi:hypothetical protein|uniref:hypothetical protein n=1 Tax=Priestia megaterium TaxID=1404 RepID=UPI002D80D92A|nr:hypothetical protein [Priestia megaterium]MEB4856924.1 hypothetical protein [Priestia megaterium]